MLNLGTRFLAFPQIKLINMEISKFLTDFAEQFDDTDASEIQEETVFHDLDEWSSLIGMSLIAMVKTEYGKTITGKEIRECVTVRDLFDMISAK